MHPRKQARLERQEKIPELLRQGLSLTQIAEKFGVPFGIINYDVTKLDKKTRRSLKKYIFTGRRRVKFAASEADKYFDEYLLLAQQGNSVKSMAGWLKMSLSKTRAIYLAMSKSKRERIRQAIKDSRNDCGEKRQRIIELLKKGYTQTEIGKKLGIKQNTVAGYLTSLPKDQRQALKEISRLSKQVRKEKENG